MDAVIPALVDQHVQEAATLRDSRSRLARSAQVRLVQLARCDERIAAHLDGIALAGPYGSARCLQALDPPGAGSVFAAGVRAIEERDARGLRRILALAQALPDARRGLVSAFGWVSPVHLRGITKALLDAAEPAHRELGLTVCAMHHVDPGSSLDAALTGQGGRRAMRAAVSIGRRDLAVACVERLRTGDPGQAFEAARAALLLGEHRHALAALHEMSATSEDVAAPALELLVEAASNAQVRDVLKSLHDNPNRLPMLVRLIGVAGDPHFVPWLIARMHEPALARRAGAAFEMITGADLVSDKLDRPAPETSAAEEDALRALAGDDADDLDLAWPDPTKVSTWWTHHGTRYAPGVRHLLGAPLSPAHGRAVLRYGSQPQRRLAAEHLCLLEPGTPLFNTVAPAWRQVRRLAALGA